MQLITAEQSKQLQENWRKTWTHPEGLGAGAHEPVVKIFNPSGPATWLISEQDPADPDTLFGLCDLGMGFPEFGHVSLSELEAVRGPFGLGLERDLYWLAKHSIREYGRIARLQGRIVA